MKTDNGNDLDDGDVEIELVTSENGCVATVTLRSSRPMSCTDFYEALEFYVRELERTEAARVKSGDVNH